MVTYLDTDDKLKLKKINRGWERDGRVEVCKRDKVHECKGGRMQD